MKIEKIPDEAIPTAALVKASLSVIDEVLKQTGLVE
jgi:hypothetical protein